MGFYVNVKLDCNLVLIPILIFVLIFAFDLPRKIIDVNRLLANGVKNEAH